MCLLVPLFIYLSCRLHRAKGSVDAIVLGIDSEPNAIFLNYCAIECQTIHGIETQPSRSTMPTEIERKFLVNDLAILKGLTGTKMAQGYIADNGMTVRVRVAGEQGFLTLKGKTQGISRAEFEYEIPLADAEALLANFSTLGRVQKVRYYLAVGELTFEIDVFEQELAGLVVAEVELPS